MRYRLKKLIHIIYGIIGFFIGVLYHIVEDPNDVANKGTGIVVIFAIFITVLNILNTHEYVAMIRPLQIFTFVFAEVIISNSIYNKFFT